MLSLPARCFGLRFGSIIQTENLSFHSSSDLHLCKRQQRRFVLRLCWRINFLFNLACRRAPFATVSAPCKYGNISTRSSHPAHRALEAVASDARSKSKHHGGRGQSLICHSRWYHAFLRAGQWTIAHVAICTVRCVGCVVFAETFSTIRTFFHPATSRSLNL